MVYRSFDQLIQSVKTNGKVQRVAVAAAQDEHALQAVYEAEKEGIVTPLLVGDKTKIEALIAELDSNWNPEIVDVTGIEEAAAETVRQVKAGNADFIMKGKLETSQLLKEVVNKEHGLGTGRIMSHIAIQEIPNYHKLLLSTDGGMLMYPDLNQKKSIIENAVDVLCSMGYDRPKVAVLGAVEKVNPKMPETIDGAALKEMNQKGEIPNCIIEGPISMDLAVNQEKAVIKGYESEVAGDADILVVPNITAGNILGKTLIELAGAKMAGLIVGASVPIVLTSRGSSAEEKYLSLTLAASAVK